MAVVEWRVDGGRNRLEGEWLAERVIEEFFGMFVLPDVEDGGNVVVGGSGFVRLRRFYGEEGREKVPAIGSGFLRTFSKAFCFSAGEIAFTAILSALRAATMRSYAWSMVSRSIAVKPEL